MVRLSALQGGQVDSQAVDPEERLELVLELSRRLAISLFEELESRGFQVVAGACGVPIIQLRELRADLEVDEHDTQELLLLVVQRCRDKEGVC